MLGKLKDIKAELRRRMHQPIPPGDLVWALTVSLTLWALIIWVVWLTV